ncbi:PREDICTED: uncharacterized protein LOC107190317, partial [Dufourea novaeangliae]|uniref:uncharacterized protein LOC107190317 n=1 Tax=Dufourea novaeangliae TaxID=178035 RepID=UPI0007677A79
MHNRRANAFVKRLEETTKKALSSSPEDNGGNRSLRQSCTPVKIKEEDQTDEIQEYAAITMSELLGWYGYEKVDSGCTRSLNLDHFTSLPHARNSQILQVDPSFISNKMKPKSSASLAAINSPFDVSSLSLPYSVNSLAAVGGEMLSSPLSLKMGALDFTANHPYKNFLSSTCSDNTSCSWCGRITQTCNSGRIDSLSCNMINTAGHFCSEACFAAGRRAVFKRAKTCDWCRHIRNPISHVDFQDGESQLQFCSDKCLNQYKMNIFCHETRTHLMLHGLNNVSCHDTEKSNLITPELWFRNCQSPAGSPTEDTRATDEHVRTDETSCRDNKSKETEQNEIQKSIEPTRKVARKKDAFCIRLCTKASNYNNEKKNNFHTEMNENDINEQNKEEALINEKNKFCHFVKNQSHCGLNCSKQNLLSCKSFKKNCNLMDAMNCDSYNHENNNVFLKKNIHIKDIRVLQEEEKDSSSENILKSSHWFTNLSTIQNGTQLPSESLTNESSRAKYEKSTNVSSKTEASVQSNEADASIHALPTSLLPPVTVLVPYPIPVPIPIPIPVPIPAPILNKFMDNEQKLSANTKDEKYNNFKCNESLKNKCSVPHDSQICTNTNISVPEDQQHIASTKLCVSLSSSTGNNESNANTHSSKHNAKPPRKRKHLNENVNYEHKEQKLK